MLRSFNDEFYSYLNELTGDTRVNELSIVTGRLASQYITQMSKDIMAKYPNISINIYTINNDFFGENITVVGLLTGKDIIEQLKGKNLGNTLLLPDVLLRHGENILLDDVTIEDIERTLQTRIRIVQSNGKSFIEAILNT